MEETKTIAKTTRAKGAATARAKKAAEKAEAPAKQAKAEAPRAVLLNDQVRVQVRSNRYGGLIFINSRTNEKTEWNHINDIQDLTVADIRDMRSTARSFFSEPWVCIGDIVTPGYEDVTHDELLAALGLTRYYSDTVTPEYLSDVIEWTLEQINENVPSMKDGVKENLAVAVGDAVRNGELNALDRIRAWEQVLNCSLLEQA